MMKQLDKNPDEKDTFHNVEKISNELQNVRLDSSPKVTVHYESDNAKKSQQPSLSQYFGGVQSSTQSSFSNVNLPVEMPQPIDDSKIEAKDEPVVCRIFAESPIQTTASQDPTKNFFDMIGQPSNTSDTTIVNDLRLSSNELNADDGFNSRLAIGNEADRRRDAWIPTDMTRKALIASATSPPGTYFPERDLLTMPGVTVEEDLNDLLQDTVAHLLGATEAAQRKILNAGDVTQDERGLRELIQAGCYTAAINLTGRLLTIYGQGTGRAGHPSKHSPHSLQLWFTRIALLIKIKSFILAEREAEPFGKLEKPDLFFQFYPDMYGGRPGSIAPFSFRLLLAELPMHCGRAKESIIKLFSILSTVKQIINNLKHGLSENGSPMELSDVDRTDSLKLWSGRETRVQHSIINSALAQKDYSLAIQVINQLIVKDEHNSNYKRALYSALGRIKLQLGDVVGAEKSFSDSKKITSTQIPDIRELVDRSLVAVAQNSFDDAYKLLVEANTLDPKNIMILNNMGVCLLYSGKLKEAIALFENAVNSNPTRGLHDALLLNLCTLYELESSHSQNKKLALLRQLARYKTDVSMNVQACLKLHM